jgi:RNA polymerase sigma factor (sigma-70 family)
MQCKSNSLLVLPQALAMIVIRCVSGRRNANYFATSAGIEKNVRAGIGFGRKPELSGRGPFHEPSADDATDLTQDVLRAVSTGAIRMEYDPQRGSFRGWLFTIAQRKLCNLLAQQRRPGRGSGDGGVQVLLDEQPDRDEADRWEEEYRRRVFAWAAECVRPTVSDTTWQAFWQTAVEGRSGAEVAAELTMTVAAVYLAKSRVMVRLKEQVQQWEQSPEQ